VLFYRITKKKLQATAFTGMGASEYPGRWNHQYTKVIYTADSLALAELELLTKLNGSDLLKAYVYFRVTVDDNALAALDLDDLPDGWYNEPPNNISRDIGEAWVRSQESVGLLLPSIVVPQQQICILNPEHPQFTDAVNYGKPVNCVFDQRLK